LFIKTLDEVLQPAGVICKSAPKGGGHQFLQVAEGEAAARFTLHGRGHTHDYAPGALLVREAGGAIIPVNDDTYTYKTRSFVACHPKLESLMQANVATFRELEALPAHS
jgi:3'-phosphoadenosine 5'-phosphosulfate (PAPS) 3'-phosphatase